MATKRQSAKKSGLEKYRRYERLHGFPKTLKLMLREGVKPLNFMRGRSYGEWLHVVMTFSKVPEVYEVAKKKYATMFRAEMEVERKRDERAARRRKV
jgi:hypothetical protein